MWTDSGTWIALGISGLFIVVGIVMHQVIKKVLKSSPNQETNNTTNTKH